MRRSSAKEGTTIIPKGSNSSGSELGPVHVADPWPADPSDRNVTNVTLGFI